LIGEHAAASGEQSPITETHVATYLSSATSRILLAEIQNRAVGLLSYSIRPDLYHAGSSCLLEELIVVEATRGHGVGSALVTELFSRLTPLACAEVSVAVTSTIVVRSNSIGHMAWLKRLCSSKSISLARTVSGFIWKKNSRWKN
jgi:ribosomal protein S18 acetylase RimI-like enzyme